MSSKKDFIISNFAKMSNQKNRINTIIALINSDPSTDKKTKNKIKSEFNQVNDVDSIGPLKRKNILKILHSTRALDTSLRSFLDHHGIRNQKHSIGQFLHQLATHTNTSIQKISQSEKTKYQKSIADIRNTHLHTADSYPKNDSEVYTLISEMQSLMTRVSSL